MPEKKRKFKELGQANIIGQVASIDPLKMNIRIQSMNLGVLIGRIDISTSSTGKYVPGCVDLHRWNDGIFLGKEREEILRTAFRLMQGDDGMRFSLVVGEDQLGLIQA